MKIFFRNEGKIEMFSDKQKLGGDEAPIAAPVVPGQREKTGSPLPLT